MKTKFINQPFSKRAMMVLAVLFTALTAGATEFITDVMVIGTLEKTDKDALLSKYQNEGWSYIEKDLNAGAGGDYIYLLYKSEANTDGVNHGYITDFYIYGSKNGIFEEEVTFGGRTYYLVPFDGSDDFKNSKGDLNRGCGSSSDYIHLYYTVDPQSDKAVSGISFDNMPLNALGNMGLSGGINGYNLNAGCSSGENIYMHITTKNATTQPVEYIKYTYDTTNGLTKKEESCSAYHIVTSGTPTFGSANKESWYVLNRSRNLDNRITVSGTVNLILCDGCTLNANKGIEVTEGNTLNVFAQSDGANAGKLNANAINEKNVAGIGGCYAASGGMVNIYSGTVEAHGGMYCAGIGGGTGGAGGTVTIYSGTVEAYGDYGAGIGGGYGGDGGAVTIYGGTVEAYGGTFGAGIGGGFEGSGGTVTIYGGIVEAHGGDSGAGIGVGYTGVGGDVTIYGGTVEAYAGGAGAGIGGGYIGDGITVTIYGGVVETHSGSGAAGIGAGYLGKSHGTLKIGDGVKVYGGDSANPTTLIATGPQENVESRPRYMIAGGHVKGDANDDLKVNAADLVEMVNAKNDKASTRFVLKNADIDGDKKITQSDIDAVVKIILKK